MSLKLARNLREIRWHVLGRAHLRFGPYLLRYKSDLLGALFCMMGGFLVVLLRPWPLKIVFDYVLPAAAGTRSPLPASVAWLLPSSIWGLLAVACAGVLGTTLLAGLFAFGQNLLAARAAHKILFRIRRDLFAHVQRLPMAFHTQRETGDLLMRLTGDIQMLREILVNSVITFLGRVLLIVGMVAIMVWLSPILTLVALSVIPLLVMVLFRFSGRLRTVTRKAKNKEGRVATVITETINAISLVQSFARAGFEDGKLARQTRSSLRASLKATRIKEGMTRSAETVVALGSCGVLAMGTSLVMAGRITPGDLLVFLSYVKSVYRPLREMARLTARLAKASICAERILDLLDLDPKITDRPDARQPPRFEGAVQLKDVSLTYGGRVRPALRQVSLNVQAGETVLLTGPSGAGKTSFASLLLRLYDPDSGSVCIDGVDVRQFRLEAMREQIAVVLQEAVLLGTTIRENIAYGKPDAGNEEILEAARKVNADGFIRNLPQGYGTIIGERGLTLSGGQRQRIALARAAIKKAPILILDEPTTGLDRFSEQAVLEGIKALIRDSTTFIICHRPETFRTVDRVVVLEEGCIISETGAAPPRKMKNAN
ncbi:MAG: ABC transporter ATP-binding protein [Acidobacteriota bacterium]